MLPLIYPRQRENARAREDRMQILSRAPEQHQLSAFSGEYLSATLNALFLGTVVLVPANLPALRWIGLRAIPCPFLNCRAA